MDKRLIAIALIVMIVAIGAIALFYHSQQNNVPISNVTRPHEGYLTIQKGAISRICLVNSSISYGIYDKDIWPMEKYYVKKGDPCVIITGTIRNDGKDEWIAMAADLYNLNGEKVGTVITDSTKPWFETVHVVSNSTGTFEITVRYDKQDVSRYDIYLSWEPTSFPPP